MYNFPKHFMFNLLKEPQKNMLTRQVLVTVLLLVPTSQSSYVKTTCEIPSVEAGDNTTLTIHFGEDLVKEQSRDFSITHLSHSGKESTLLNCQFNNGIVDCDNKTCCTWERKVTNVFRVHMHSASQDLEGKFWGFVIPADTDYQKYCIFTLKASSCSRDSINTTNGHVTCSSQPVTIGQNCTVNCNSDHFFQENQTFVTFTCVGKNAWFPEIPVISCEASTCSTDFINASNNHLSCTTQPVTIGQTCKVTCAFGQENQISVTYTCVGKNKWFPELPVLSCEGQPKSHNSYENYLLLLCIIPVIIVIVIVIVIWKCHKKKVKEDRAENDEEHPLVPETPEIQQSKEEYLLQCIKKWYPELQSQTYFFPPFPSQISQNCDMHDRRALDYIQRVLQFLADNSQQVMMVISRLHLSKYLGKPNCAAADVSLPSPSLQHYDQGDRCLLIIHSKLGLLRLHITCVGDDFSQLTMTEQDGMVTKKVKEAVKQLNNAEVVLPSDLTAIKHVTKILVLPNISSSQLQRAVKGTRLFPIQDLCQCLGVQSVDDAVKLCLLSDQLPSSSVNDSWWQHVIEASGPEQSLTSELYEQLVARFYGEAATVEVHYDTAQHLNIRTLAVSETGERVARFVLCPQQADILNQSPLRAFLSGPPGTGKTIVLIMQGLTWLQRGHDVHVVSTCNESRAVTFVIEHQLQETVKTSTARSRVHRRQFDLNNDGVKKAVTSLQSSSTGKQLCVIADEVMPCYRESFTEFCDQLIKEVPAVYIWGASMYHDVRPLCLEEVKLTTPLGSPPVVVRAVMESDEIKNGRVHVYMVSDVPFTKDGPTVINIQHNGQPDHTISMPQDCVECGHKIAHVLTDSLKVGRTGDSNVPPSLQYCDVLVLCFSQPTTASGLVQGLRDRKVPVRVVKEGDEAAIRDTALGVGDLVTVASWGDVRGLQRKVVVVASGTDKYDRLHAMSRCTSQLVVIDREGVID